MRESVRDLTDPSNCRSAAMQLHDCVCVSAKSSNCCRDASVSGGKSRVRESGLGEA